jgi:hypothetical protein
MRSIAPSFGLLNGIELKSVAGYYLEGIKELVGDGQWGVFVNRWSGFGVDTLTPIADLQRPLFVQASILSNILGRGRMVKPSIWLERKFEAVCKVSDRRGGLAGSDWVVGNEKKIPASKLFCKLVLSPIAIARIQKVVLQYIAGGYLSLQAQEWNIGIVERDVSCARWAIDDLRQWLQHLLVLGNISYPLPNIRLTVFSGAEHDVSLDTTETPYPLDALDDIFSFDLLLDISLLAYSPRPLPEYLTSRYQASVYSVREPLEMSSFYGGHAPSYPSLCDLNGVISPEKRASLRYLLASIFRHDDFRGKQIALLDWILQGQNTLGVLPSGIGKSVVVYLAGLLRPGITLIVCPSDELGAYHKRQLDGYDIDSATILQVDAQQTNLPAHNQLGMFVCIKPIALRLEIVRHYLKDLTQQNTLLSQFVWDEVHTLSEWSSDFRMYGTGIGEIARRLLHSRVFSYMPPFVGLTAAATYEAMIDIQNELWIRNACVVREEAYQYPDFEVDVLPVGEVQMLDNNKRDIIERQEALWVEILQTKQLRSADLIKGVKHNERGLAYMYRHEQPIHPKLEGLVAQANDPIGVIHPELGYSLHLTMPLSIEQLYRESHRVWSDSKHYLPYSRQQVPMPRFGGFANTFEKERHYIEHYRSFKGQDKEQGVAFKLLDIVSFPAELRSGNTLGIERLLQQATLGDTFRLQIALTSNVEQAIQQLQDYIVDQYFLIVKMKAMLNNGDWFDLSPDKQILREAVHETTLLASNIEDFLYRLGRNYKLAKRKKDQLTKIYYEDYQIEFKLPADDRKRQEVVNVFLSIRHADDTLRTLHRFIMLGIVDDYTIEPGGQFISILFTKRNDEYYFRRLYRYLRDFQSEQSALNTIAILKNASFQGSALQKNIDYFLQFTYDYIAKHHLQAIEQIHKITEECADMHSVSWKSLFLPRYNHPLYDVNLLDDTRQGQAADITVVWKYMDAVGNESLGHTFVGNLWHLRQTSLQLHSAFPNNPVYSLLYAFTVIYLETNLTEEQGVVAKDEKRLDEGVQFMIDGFIQMKNIHKWTPSIFINHAERYKQFILIYRRELNNLLTQFNDWLHVETQSHWLQQFNNKFLVGYDRE